MKYLKLIVLLFLVIAPAFAAETNEVINQSVERDLTGLWIILYLTIGAGITLLFWVSIFDIFRGK